MSQRRFQQDQPSSHDVLSSERSHYSDDEQEGDDLAEYEQKDYNPIPELDRYDEAELDQEEYSDMSYGQREKAEEEIDFRQRQYMAQQ